MTTRQPSAFSYREEPKDEPTHIIDIMLTDKQLNELEEALQNHPELKALLIQRYDNDD